MDVQLDYIWMSFLDGKRDSKRGFGHFELRFTTKIDRLLERKALMIDVRWLVPLMLVDDRNKKSMSYVGPFTVIHSSNSRSLTPSNTPPGTPWSPMTWTASSRRGDYTSLFNTYMSDVVTSLVVTTSTRHVPLRFLPKMYVGDTVCWNTHDVATTSFADCL
ncbi:hypothetical protein Sjap_003114 [Stephania japonica]|uniref:Uncharacterized protein n=1 Tax=Stephania japonica TaxID=461633 RepID=A0AAP0PV53_9MAGN